MTSEMGPPGEEHSRTRGSRKISLKDLRSSGRRFVKHSSKVSMQVKTWGSAGITALNIPVGFASAGHLPLTSFFRFLKASRWPSATSPLPTSCFRIDLTTLLIVHSCWVRKSSGRLQPQYFSPIPWSHRLSITKELVFPAVSGIRFFQRTPPLTSDMFCKLSDFPEQNKTVLSAPPSLPLKFTELVSLQNLIPTLSNRSVRRSWCLLFGSSGNNPRRIYTSPPGLLKVLLKLPIMLPLCRRRHGLNMKLGPWYPIKNVGWTE